MESSLERIIELAKMKRRTGRIAGTSYFFKSKSGLFRSRYGKRTKKYGVEISIEDEYNTLTKIHEVIPENSPKPITLIRDDKGSPNGYLMTIVPGRKLERYLSIPDKTRKSLASALTKLRESNVVHGDLRTKNILVTGDNVSIIDPFGTNCYADYKKKDAEQDAVFENSIMKAFPPHTQTSGNPYGVLLALVDRFKYEFNARVAYHIGNRGSTNIPYLR